MAEAATDTTKPREETDHKCGCKGGPSARAILDRRYARGEVTREQYQQMKEDLGGDAKSGKGKKGCC